MARISRVLQDGLQIRAGINGNWYAFCNDRNVLEILCYQIGKSPGSIYYNMRYKCYAVRVRAAKHRERLKRLKIRNEQGI